LALEGLVARAIGLPKGFGTYLHSDPELLGMGEPSRAQEEAEET
jgi:hypothetical protein